MTFTVKELAEILQGKVEGNPDLVINKISKIEEAKEGSVTFLANPLYTPYIYTTKASAVIVSNSFIPESRIESTLIRVEDSYTSFARLLDFYVKEKNTQLVGKGISKQAFISPDAKTGKNLYLGEFSYIGSLSVIGDNVKIYPQVYIGDNVSINDNTTLYPGVKVYADNKIGRNCTIHSGVIIGSDGFGFAQQNDFNYLKVAQIGNVIIEDDVEIGSNTTIDRATLGSTIIRKGVKLDNQIQIAHNVEIGENTVIAAQTGISGSTKIGRNCMIGGQVGIIGHLTIGDNVRIAAQSGVGANIESGSIVQGSPAFEVSKYRKSYVHFRNFNDIVKRINEIEKSLKDKLKS
jgi:UDP-3-O-[3-hydroxymyristoyl] glucosamine N-acyltransferase